MNFWIAFAGIILLGIWITAGGFVTQASTLFHADRNVNEFSHRAYWYTFWAAFVTWTLVGIALIVGFLSLFGIFEIFSISTVVSSINPTKARGVGAGTVLFLLLCMALVFTTGVLSALAADNINKSNLLNENNEKLNKGYFDCIVAAVTSLSAGGLLVIIFIAVIIVGEIRKHKEQKLIDERKKKRETNEKLKIKNERERQNLETKKLEIEERLINRLVN